MDANVEYAAGIHDAELDIAKHGTKYSNDLMEGQEKSWPGKLNCMVCFDSR